MAVKCLKCNYEMKTGQEVSSATTHILVGGFNSVLKIIETIKEWLPSPSKFMAGPMNLEIGDSKGVKCPNCGEYGRWEDVKRPKNRGIRSLK